MRAAGHTARSLSLAAGLSPDAARNVLTGRSQKPNQKTIYALAKALDVSVEFLRDSDDTVDILEDRAAMEIREVDLGAAPSNDGDFMHGRPVRFTWLTPADFFAALGTSTADIVLLRVLLGPPGVVAGDRLMVDLSKKTAYPPGLVVIWLQNEGVYDLARIEPPTSRRGDMIVNLELSWGHLQLLSSDFSIIGRVIGKWIWL